MKCLRFNKKLYTAFTLGRMAHLDATHAPAGLFSSRYEMA